MLKNNILITLDYELFFGSKVGSVEQCILTPTNKLLALLNKHAIKATFFVDSGYLVKLQEFRKIYPLVEEEYQKVLTQIQKLDKEGHSIQLHIHPHWEDSYHNGQEWVMDTTRYRLHDFSETEIEDIVSRYKKALTDIVGDKVFAHRAGGWCIQPFLKIKNALKKHNIYMDSTLFKNGKNDSQTHYFNFKDMPSKTEWSFEDDPLKEEKNGFFKEVPISAYRLSPFFFWKLVYFKKFGGIEHQGFGDGTAAGGSRIDKLRMLTKYTHSVVSIDGYKASFLEKAYRSFLEKKALKNFVIIGHPKSMSEYSLKKLEQFILNNKNETFITMRSFKNEL